MSPKTKIAAIAPTAKLSQNAGAARNVMSLYEVGELSDVATETATPLTASPTPAMATVLFKARSFLAFSRSVNLLLNRRTAYAQNCGDFGQLFDRLVRTLL
ncbi:MAG: hypothetical protein WBB29_09610 [Geitlerinemataceae cyanobacterium]